MKNLFTAPVVALDFLEKERNKMDKVVLAGGGFDILHEGHIRHLQKAKSLGNILIVHITGDERMTEKKGFGRPIFKEDHRALVVSSIRFVDYVFIFNGRHFDQKVVDAIKPDIIFFNQEAFNGETKRAIGKLKHFSGKIIVSDQKKIDSSSRAIKAL